jgi:uncharacterized protein (DUF302 family)
VEDKIGTMLHCNVILQETEDGRTEVAAVDPVASMLAVDKLELESVAKEVRSRLQRVISRLYGGFPRPRLPSPRVGSTFGARPSDDFS